MRFSSSATPLLKITDAHIYQFGSVKPVYKRPLSWTISGHGENWAIVGDGKATLLDVLRGRLRIAPPPAGGLGLWPLLVRNNPAKDPFSSIAYASFATRRNIFGGGFYDFTARYGGVRDEDRITLRESLLESLAAARGEHGPGESSSIGEDDVKGILDLTERLGLSQLLDLPLIALSNGQTRRAHVIRELLKKPQILLLDDPLTGLDVQQRPQLLKILHELHQTQHPRIILGLRKHDNIPEWVTHVAYAHGDVVDIGKKEDLSAHLSAHSMASPPKATPHMLKTRHSGKIAVEAKNLNVAYQERKVLRDINWTIHEGERWHLRGANGSGKTTLLSVLTGDHPQSYTQPYLHLFGRPRKSSSTVQIQQQIGFVSPELFNAFPRRMGPQGLTVRDAIATGLHSTFAYRVRTPEEDARVDEILRDLGPEKWDYDDDGTSGTAKRTQDTFAAQLFAALPMGEQSLVLLMRALVAKAPLIILDEAFAGMSENMVNVAKAYLRDALEERQAAVFITHWEEEVPWPDVKRLTLVDGMATVS
ncbi:hypothetical protein FRB99_005437 [Tulasnella sp. 403]|nr:hypothetical protein FRB99_005437 [Tulasnella sp. 403]